MFVIQLESLLTGFPTHPAEAVATRRHWRYLAVATHLLGPFMTFLPGLALWFWAWDRDDELARQGRSAFRFQLLLFLGYIFIATRVNVDAAGLFLTFRFVTLGQWLQSLTWRNGSGTFALAAGTLGFCFLYASSMFFSLFSALRVFQGRSAWYPNWLSFPLPVGGRK